MSHPLFFGERTKKVVDATGFRHVLRLRTQEVDVQPALIVNEGKFLPGVYIFESEETTSRWFLSPVAMIPEADGSDVIAAYRTYRLLAMVSKVDLDALLGAVIAPMPERMKSHLPEGFLEQKVVALREQITPAVFDLILTEVPTSLEGILQALTSIGAIELDDNAKSAITDEVEAGRIVLSAGLKALGIESPEERGERRRKEEEFFAPLMPHLEAYLAESVPSGTETSGCMEVMRQVAKFVAKHGIDDAAMQVGLACFVHTSRRKYGNQPDWSQLMSCCLAGRSDANPMQAIREVAAFLATRFGPESGRDAYSYVGQMFDVVDRWVQTSASES